MNTQTIENQEILAKAKNNDKHYEINGIAIPVMTTRPYEFAGGGCTFYEFKDALKEQLRDYGHDYISLQHYEPFKVFTSSELDTFKYSPTLYNYLTKQNILYVFELDKLLKQRDIITAVDIVNDYIQSHWSGHLRCFHFEYVEKNIVIFKYVR